MSKYVLLSQGSVHEAAHFLKHCLRQTWDYGRMMLTMT